MSTAGPRRLRAATLPALAMASLIAVVAAPRATLAVEPPAAKPVECVLIIENNDRFRWRAEALLASVRGAGWAAEWKPVGDITEQGIEAFAADVVAGGVQAIVIHFSAFNVNTDAIGNQLFGLFVHSVEAAAAAAGTPGPHYFVYTRAGISAGGVADYAGLSGPAAANMAERVVTFGTPAILDPQLGPAVDDFLTDAGSTCRATAAGA